MTDEIRQAFAHPSERAEASAHAPRDRISLRDYTVEVEIGAFQQERGTLQRVRFNIAVEVTPERGPIDDDVDRILSYDRLTEAIGIELGAERINLLETLAERVAWRILAEPRAARVFVRIEKIDRGPYDLGVEIVRSREGDDLPASVHQEAPHPRVAYLSNAAIEGDGLSHLLDRLTDGPPLILTVGPSDRLAPQADQPLAQRRIDLLAIEQNAWVLAGRDRRCVVTGSRTELDWAMKNGQTCVWAPSKIVLDAVESPATGDPLALAAWFAAEMSAAELVVVGVEPPEAEVPVRTEVA
ncbi:dihydroneopterin aldolase [Histidinibacterium aquaticum]|uniref:Diguanylate cyclase n=1 Tax=Histidinibacterium aquaticum TaxID=2613962 RepID=A0A5J5GPZ8_9RHOB|nr:dihydroneopterin aldolase [Histidinibacterium aquaticum]KAA9010135.1 diguanylate cyclase [Histidinibacterium aquaticum]